MRRGDLDDLAAFAAVARHRSFTRAAAELGVSPSALSHAMRGLEERLGVRLLARTTRCVAPTAGRRAAAAVAGACARRGRTGPRRRWPTGAARPPGRCGLTTFGYAARTVLAPRLPRFLLDHPDVSVEVIVDDRLIDLVAAGFDAGIRFGETVERDMVAVRVGPDLRTVVVGTPAYFARYPRPATPADLEAHRCVNYRLSAGAACCPGSSPATGARSGSARAGS